MRPIDADALDFGFPITDDAYGLSRQIGIELVRERINAAPTIEQPKWIPVTERLPNEGGTYLVCQDFSMWGVEHKAIGIEQFVKQFGGWYCDGVKIRGITHWMPLPQPYKEKEE